MLNLMDVNPPKRSRMYARTKAISPIQIVCWSQAPKAQRHG